MKLSVVVPFLNQIDLTEAVINQLIKVSSPDTEFIIINNGSSVEKDLTLQPSPDKVHQIKGVRNNKNIGVYPTFKQGFKEATGDVVAFFHSDLVVWEEGWDKKVLEEFERRSNLGMIGFIGSNEIDTAGGRGLGTTSSFMGKELDRWTGSAAHIHGKVSKEFSKAAVVDGCAMIIRRDAWEEIGFREDFPLHHFYDRLISTQLLEKGWDIGVLGIECDHISGQTVNQEQAYADTAKAWCNSIGIAEAPKGWDDMMYRVAEARWLGEYRDIKHVVPIKINN